MIGVNAAGFVPVAFVDGDHFSSVAGDAAVGEEVGWVGEDEVDGAFGNFGEDVEAVALVDAEVVFRVVEGQGFCKLRMSRSAGRVVDKFGHATFSKGAQPKVCATRLIDQDR